MRLDSSAPLIGIPVDVRRLDDQPFHVVGEKYITAVAEAAAGLPVLIPALGHRFDLEDLVQRLDGAMLTGSPSNVAVHHYGGPPDRPDSPQDPDRDAITLPLIRAALSAGLPLFCICRGFQELNVALGGTLHTQIHLQPERHDHRAPQGRPYDERYGPRHPVHLTPGGMLARILGTTEIQVNSLHWQGIDRPAEELAIEAQAPDGTIEAVQVKNARGFALAVQWHPEYRVLENPASLALFRAFGDAARAFAQAKRARRAGQAA
jgi:putative glutamine amidotransferase